MNQQESNLFFNCIVIKWPPEPVTCYFSQATAAGKRLYRNAVPAEVKQKWPGTINDNSEFIYTTFEFPKAKFVPVVVNLAQANPEFIKHFYRDRLYRYFSRVKHLILRRGFIDNLEIWVRSNKFSDNVYTAYEKFSLRIQYELENKNPTLILSYEHLTRVLQKPIAELIQKVPPTAFGKVLYRDQIFTFKKLQEAQQNIDFTKVYPVARSALRNVLEIEEAPRVQEIKYQKYLERITLFYNYFLRKPSFFKIFPGAELGFMDVPLQVFFKVNKQKATLSFENYDEGNNPKVDFRNLRPAQKSPYVPVNFFFVYHADDRLKRDELHRNLINGLRFYKGLTSYTGILSYFDHAADIVFTNKEDPLPEINEKFQTYPYNITDSKYFAIYLTPFTKFETKNQANKVYIKVKEFLLHKEIVCQGLEPNRIGTPDFVFTLTNMSVSILAKLEGLPWKLKTESERDLVVGIGAHRNRLDGITYISSAFCFDNSGKFNSFDYFIKQETAELAGSIVSQVKNFIKVHGSPQRLIIHFYKTISKKELKPIEKALSELSLQDPIPIFIVSINKTESTDIVAFDKKVTYLMPESGTYIRIGKKKYLLFNNARNGNSHKHQDGYHFPLKMSIDCNQKELLNDTTVTELITQVYQFSRLYFKSLAQQNLPVTIKYSEIIAEILPYFTEKDLPEFAKNKLWFI